MGLIADPNRTHLQSHNLTCELSITLKFGPNVSLTYYYCLMRYEGDSLKTCRDMIHQSWEFGKAIRPLFAEPVTYLVVRSTPKKPFMLAGFRRLGEAIKI